jgi:hypothetical protein
MSNPDPSITAGLLSKLPTKKAEGHNGASALPEKKGHAGPHAPMSTKLNSRSAEKATVPGRTRTSNRGK